MIHPDRNEQARWRRLTKEQANGCILFLGESSADGYGRWRPRPGAQMIYAHRYAYEVYVGDIPDGMQVDHRCHTDDTSCPGGSDCTHRRCSNPAHLELVTNSENTLRQRHAKRLTESCPKGHPYSDDNTVIWSDGKRRCRACLATRRAARNQSSGPSDR